MIERSEGAGNYVQKMLLNCLILLCIGLSQAAFIARSGSAFTRRAPTQRRPFCSTDADDDHDETPSTNDISKFKFGGSSYTSRIDLSRYTNGLRIKSSPTDMVSVPNLVEEIVAILDEEIVDILDEEKTKAKKAEQDSPESTTTSARPKTTVIKAKPKIMTRKSYNKLKNTKKTRAPAPKKSTTITKFNKDLLKCVNAAKEQDYEVLKKLIDKYAGDQDALYTIRGHFLINLGIDDLNYLEMEKAFIDQYGTSNPLFFNGLAYLFGLNLNPPANSQPNNE